MSVVEKLKSCFILSVVAIMLFNPVVAAAEEYEDDYNYGESYDPIEPVNRATHSFNEFLDIWILAPKIKFYKRVVPLVVRDKVSNVFRNLRMPVVFFNSVLQGDPQNAFSAFWSFLLNSTLGVAGIFDFASVATNLEVRPEDFGQTLGYWGVGEGFYLVLPILGPSNLRDTFGLGVDFFTDPYNILKSREAIVVRMALEGLDTRYRVDDAINDVRENSFDTYSTFRSGNKQRRDAMIENSVK
jgi:phospholipid-binding lipoprotein MlaA